MEYRPFSAAHLDYLQPSGADPTRLSPGGSGDQPPAWSRRLWRLNGVGFIEKSLDLSTWRRIRLPTEDLLIGLYQ